jgi:hypothetical protein
MPDSLGDFGCATCWPATAEAAYASWQEADPVKELVDESHYIVRVVACRTCRQHFLNVFTELIDWDDGEDPCCRRRIPLTPKEAQSLTGDVSEQQLMALAPGRKCLAFDWPKDGPTSVYWTQGLRIGPHD